MDVPGRDVGVQVTWGDTPPGVAVTPAGGGVGWGGSPWEGLVHLLHPAPSCGVQPINLLRASGSPLGWVLPLSPVLHRAPPPSPPHGRWVAAWSTPAPSKNPSCSLSLPWIPETGCPGSLQTALKVYALGIIVIIIINNNK